MMCDGKEARMGKHDWSGLEAVVAAAAACGGGTEGTMCETFGTEYTFFIILI